MRRSTVATLSCSDLSYSIGLRTLRTVVCSYFETVLGLSASGAGLIVSEASPLRSVSREKLSGIFLKKEKSLPDGREAMPVDIEGHGKVRIAFTNTIHKRSLVAVDNYWNQQIFGGKDTPPPAMAREADVVGFVRGNPNAVGYVAATTELGPGVRVLRVE